MTSSGIRAEMEIARLTAICRKTDCGPLENEIVRLRAQIRAPEEGNGEQIKALEAEKADLQAEKSDQAAKHDEDYKGIWDLYIQRGVGQEHAAVPADNRTGVRKRKSQGADSSDEGGEF